MKCPGPGARRAIVGLPGFGVPGPEDKAFVSSAETDAPHRENGATPSVRSSANRETGGVRPADRLFRRGAPTRTSVRLVGALVLLCVVAAAGMAVSAGAAPLSTSGAQIDATVTLNPDPNTGDVPTGGRPTPPARPSRCRPHPGPFAPGTNVVLVECEAPNGVLPTKTSECDPGNTQSADSILATSSGGFTYGNYQIWALPDTGGQLGPSTITCGDTAATECVVGMFYRLQQRSPIPRSSPRPSASPRRLTTMAPTRVMAAWLRRPPPPRPRCPP